MTCRSWMATVGLALHHGHLQRPVTKLRAESAHSCILPNRGSRRQDRRRADGGGGRGQLRQGGRTDGRRADRRQAGRTHRHRAAARSGADWRTGALPRSKAAADRRHGQDPRAGRRLARRNARRRQRARARPGPFPLPGTREDVGGWSTHASLHNQHPILALHALYQTVLNPGRWRKGRTTANSSSPGRPTNGRAPTDELRAPVEAHEGPCRRAACRAGDHRPPRQPRAPPGDQRRWRRFQPECTHAPQSRRFRLTGGVRLVIARERLPRQVRPCERRIAEVDRPQSASDGRQVVGVGDLFVAQELRPTRPSLAISGVSNGL